MNNIILWKYFSQAIEWNCLDVLKIKWKSADVSRKKQKIVTFTPFKVHISVPGGRILTNDPIFLIYSSCWIFWYNQICHFKTFKNWPVKGGPLKTTVALKLDPLWNPNWKDLTQKLIISWMAWWIVVFLPIFVTFKPLCLAIFKNILKKRRFSWFLREITAKTLRQRWKFASQHLQTGKQSFSMSLYP